MLTIKIHKTHYYTLDNISKELLVFEEDIQNHAIVNRFSVPREGSKIKDTHGYNLSFYRKKNFLVLSTPSSYLIVWETTNRGEVILNTEKKNFALYLHIKKVFFFEIYRSIIISLCLP